MIILNEGDLIFTFNITNPLSKLIYIFSEWNYIKKVQFTHSAYYLGNGLIAEMQMEGLVISRLNKYLNDHFRIAVKSLKHRIDMRPITYYFLEKVGKRKYSVLQLFAEVMSRIFGVYTGDVDTKKDHCTEIIIRAFREAGDIELVDHKINPANVSPGELFRSKELYLKYRSKK